MASFPHGWEQPQILDPGNPKGEVVGKAQRPLGLEGLWPLVLSQVWEEVEISHNDPMLSSRPCYKTSCDGQQKEVGSSRWLPWQSRRTKSVGLGSGEDSGLQTSSGISPSGRWVMCEQGKVGCRVEARPGGSCTAS